MKKSDAFSICRTVRLANPESITIADAGWNTVVDEHSPWMALRQRLGSRLVSAALGCERQVIAMFGVVSCDVHDNGTSAITAAVAAAKAADTVLLFVGTNPIGNVLSCPPGSVTCRLTTEAEGVDRASLELPGVQPDLIRAVHAANPNVVLVMLNGGPLAIEWPAAHVPAIVEAFFPGELGGDAIASVLMGDVSPTGRLPVTVYPADFIARNMTDYDLASGNGTTHLYYRGKPIYPFSWSKSYSHFEFALAGGTEEAEQELSALSLASEAALLRYSVRVTNVGGAAAAVAVQAFLSSSHADAVTNEELVDFAKSGVLQPGASETIRLTVPREQLALIDDLGDERIEPGDYTLRFGGHGSGVSREMDFVEARLRVTGEARYMWRLSRARAAWRASTGSESRPDDLQRVASIRPSGAGLKTDDRQLTAPPRPLLRNAPNIYGGSSFGRNELYQDCTGSMFAFSGADGPTNERSHFVAFWAPQRWTLRWCGMNVPAANSTLTAAFHPDSNVADETVEVATSDVLVVRHRTLHRDLVMVWARWNLLVGRADAITLQGASPVGGHGSTCGCVKRRTPIGWLVLCHDKGSTLQFAVAFDTSNLDAAIDAAQQATCGTAAVDVDDTVARRLAPLDALPTLPNATLDRLSKKVYSIARLNTLSSEGAVRQHWATPDKSPHQMEYPWDTAFHAWGQLEIRPTLAAEMLTHARCVELHERWRDPQHVCALAAAERTVRLPSAAPLLGELGGVPRDAGPRLAWAIVPDPRPAHRVDPGQPRPARWAAALRRLWHRERDGQLTCFPHLQRPAQLHAADAPSECVKPRSAGSQHVDGERDEVPGDDGCRPRRFVRQRKVARHDSAAFCQSARAAVGREGWLLLLSQLELWRVFANDVCGRLLADAPRRGAARACHASGCPLA